MVAVAGQAVRQLCSINIATRKNNPNPSTLHGNFTRQQGGKPNRARRLDEYLHAGEKKHHGSTNIIFRHQQDVPHRALENREGQATRCKVAHAIGDRCRWGNAQPLAGLGKTGKYR